jgi:hypothetical protein
MTTQTLPSGPTVDTNAAANYLGMSPGTLAVWRATNRYPELKYIRVGRKRIRYRIADLEEFLQASTVGKSAE